MTHGHAGPGRTTPERALRARALIGPPLAAVAFGHSHHPMIERRTRLWLLNPGSHTDRRREPTFSVIRLAVADGSLRPELIRYASRT